VLIKDGSKMWVVCKQCGNAFDIRDGGQCPNKCGNVRAAPLGDRDGAVMIIADDGDEVYYDNDK
jgi:nitrite reductase/ring-hydroxylating ferredoxin subunit